MASLQLTVLGSGTSMGVPTLACHCAVCGSTDPHDKRTRPSVLLAYNGRNVAIDTSPDFRFQAMREKIDRLDAVLYTHSHADHILGLDDIRPYNLKQRSAIPAYATAETQVTLRRQFAYVFDHVVTESSVPEVEMHTIDWAVRFIWTAVYAGASAARAATGAGFSFWQGRVPDGFQRGAGELEGAAARAG